MPSKKYIWINETEDKRKLLLSIVQPVTAKQISRKTNIGTDTCSYILSKFTVKGLVTCLNPKAKNSRLYWLTESGLRFQKRLCREAGQIEIMHDFPDVNWELYGWICFNHRAAIIRILTEPMQPSEMKRRLRQIGSDVRISANNIRDIIRLFLKKSLVQKVFVRKKAHPRYELTQLGQNFRQLLIKA